MPFPIPKYLPPFQEKKTPVPPLEEISTERLLATVWAEIAQIKRTGTEGEVEIGPIISARLGGAKGVIQYMRDHDYPIERYRIRDNERGSILIRRLKTDRRSDIRPRPDLPKLEPMLKWVTIKTVSRD